MEPFAVTRKRKLRALIDARQKELVELCSKTIGIPTDNPPGDTRQLAHFLKDYLGGYGINAKVYEPRPETPILVASLEGSRKTPHLILNAHMDQFPADMNQLWDFGPYCGEVRDGKICGRGAGDMKGGLSALTFAFCLLKEMNLNLPGKVTLTIVSDEETGGRWGTGWLLENVQGLAPDACLNSEPSGLTVRIGEKGIFQIRLRASGKQAHGSFAGYAGDNAITKMAKTLPLIENFRNIRDKSTGETEWVTQEAMKGFEVQYGHVAPGMSKALRHVSVNIGMIRGGTKVNIVPRTCEMEIDMRLPLGVTQQEIKRRLNEELGKTNETITWEYLAHESTIFDANYTSPRERIVEILCRNAAEVAGKPPLFSFTSGATDCRYFRKRNVPSAVYGPTVHNMAAANEYITVDDLVTVTKVHACSIVDFLVP